MRRWTMPFSSPITAMAIVATCVSSAVAQDAIALFERAASAMRDVESFKAQIKLSGEGADFVKKTMPSGFVDYKAMRSAEDPALWIERFTGVVQEGTTGRNGAPDPLQIDIMLASDRIMWIDHTEKVVSTRTPSMNLRSKSATYNRFFQIPEAMSVSPFERELAATEFRLEEPQTIAGQECQVVYVKYAESAQERRGGATVLTGSARWFLADSDGLPRRVERLTESDLFNIAMVTEFQNVTTNAPLDMEAMKVPVPASYTEDVRLPQAVTQTPAEFVDDAEYERREAAKSAPIDHGRPRAPSFSAETIDGVTVTNDTVSGRISVLYFWGTWCLPCRAFSPEISNLVSTFEGQPVDVYGIAVRERNPQAAADYMAEKEYKHTLLVNGDDAAKSFNVRVYPTVVLIGASGEIVARESMRKDAEAKDIVEGIATEIRAYLEREG